MIRKIVLVAETPEARSELVRRLAADGVQVVQQPTLHAAASLLRDPDRAASILVLNTQLLSKSEVDLLADLSSRHPQVQIMIFTSRACREEVLSRLKACSQIEISSVPFGDPASYASVLQALNKAVALLDSSAAIVSSGSPATCIHEELGQRSGKDRQDAADPLYDEEFLRRVGRSDVPVLLHGETGVGKEVMARKLWTYSNRVGKPS